jgi:uncharacterized protein (DUF305 family)
VAAVLLALAALSACSSARPAEQPTPAPAPAAPPVTPAPKQQAAAPAEHRMDDMADMPGMKMDAAKKMDGMNGMDMPVTIPKNVIYTVTDVRFMQGMIAHHAQAIYMSRLAQSHGANAHLLKFTQKIDQSQTAEIKLMQDWLRANNQIAPDTSSWRHMQMAGMLTAEQLAQLDSARGKEFDRLFLLFMIQHHQGALKMVDDLFANPRAGQDIDVSVFANDVVTVQTAEIGTMYKMLDAL